MRYILRVLAWNRGTNRGTIVDNKTKEMDPGRNGRYGSIGTASLSWKWNYLLLLTWSSITLPIDRYIHIAGNDKHRISPFQIDSGTLAHSPPGERYILYSVECLYVLFDVHQLLKGCWGWVTVQTMWNLMWWMGGVDHEVTIEYSVRFHNFSIT